MDQKSRTYLSIGDGRLLNIRVILDNNLVYERMVENAPDELKQLKYSEVKMGNPITHIVFSQINKWNVFYNLENYSAYNRKM